MPPRPRRDYWDTGVFLALFQRSDDAKLRDQREHSIRLLEDVRKGGAIIVTSAFTLAEARHGDGFPPLDGEEHATLSAFFKHSYIEVVPVDRAIAALAAEYGERFHLKPADATHLATAVRSKVSRLLAWDGDFHRTQAMKDAPIPIEYPLRPPDPIPPLLEAIEAAIAADVEGDEIGSETTDDDELLSGTDDSMDMLDADMEGETEDEEQGAAEPAVEVATPPVDGADLPPQATAPPPSQLVNRSGHEPLSPDGLAFTEVLEGAQGNPTARPPIPRAD